MGPHVALLLELAKILVSGYPHLQPHIDAVNDHEGPAANAVEKEAEKVGTAVVEDVIKDEVAKVAEPTAEAPAQPTAQADEYTGDGRAAE